MAAKRAESPLIVIVGPTASGKTAVAVELAEKYNGEIICADSRTVYKGMDIGTAKPTQEERSRVPHWGLDLVEPDQQFSAADFKKYADEKIADIRARNKVPFLVGGTGLYIDAVLFDFQFGDKAHQALRSYLENLNLEELHEYCKKNNIILPENSHNKRYVIRAIERKGRTGQRRDTPVSNSVIVGIATEKQLLRERIQDRSEQLLTYSVVEEAKMLGKKYGWEHESLTGNIYPLLKRHLDGDISLKEIGDKFTTIDWRLAKRQLTWFRSNPYIVWLQYNEVASYLKPVLATE